MRTVSRIRVLGSGSSSSTPTIRCLLKKEGPCPQCHDAIENPLTSKNKRNNPGILLETEVLSSSSSSSTSTSTNNNNNNNEPLSILVDIGKTFRDSVLRIGAKEWAQDIPPVKALLLTHFHADAMNSLDDIREFSMEPLPCFCDHVTAQHIQRRDPHLIRKSEMKHKSAKEENASKPIAERRFVGSLEINPVEISHEEAVVKKNVDILGLPVDFCPLFHGMQCTAAGFIFPTSDGKRVAYFSDVGRICPEKDKGLIDASRNCDLLFLDCLSGNLKFAPNWVHFTLDQTIEAAKLIQPKRLKLIGIGHTDDHDVLNQQLRTGLEGESFADDAECSFDGMIIDFSDKKKKNSTSGSLLSSKL